MHFRCSTFTRNLNALVFFSQGNHLRATCKKYPIEEIIYFICCIYQMEFWVITTLVANFVSFLLHPSVSKHNIMFYCIKFHLIKPKRHRHSPEQMVQCFKSSRTRAFFEAFNTLYHIFVLLSNII